MSYPEDMQRDHPVLNEVRLERERQDRKWGTQEHTPAEWLMILGEEVGEANREALEQHFGMAGVDSWAAYRKELIQVAAVAVAMVQCLDRNKWRNT